MTATSTVPIASVHDSIVESATLIAAAMVKARVLRLKIPSGWEIELHPSAFVTAAVVTEEHQESIQACKCGHDLPSEHSEAGCLRGCPLEACVPDDAGVEP
jgi:hypothetical protein